VVYLYLPIVNDDYFVTSLLGRKQEPRGLFSGKKSWMIHLAISTELTSKICTDTFSVRYAVLCNITSC